MSYVCPTCQRRYESPLPLSEPPTCSGGKKHKPTMMVKK